MPAPQGIPCCVLSGATPENLYRLFDGEQIGTVFGTKTGLKKGILILEEVRGYLPPYKRGRKGWYYRRRLK